jgi:hypothetical protein
VDKILEMDTLGILRTTRAPSDMAWLSDEAKRFVLDLHLAGEAGLHRREVQKFSKRNPDALLHLEVKELASWLNDKTGRPTFFALTWRGSDLAQRLLAVARNESRGLWRPPAPEAPAKIAS